MSKTFVLSLVLFSSLCLLPKQAFALRSVITFQGLIKNPGCDVVFPPGDIGLPSVSASYIKTDADYEIGASFTLRLTSCTQGVRPSIKMGTLSQQDSQHANYFVMQQQQVDSAIDLGIYYSDAGGRRYVVPGEAMTQELQPGQRSLTLGYSLVYRASGQVQPGAVSLLVPIEVAFS